MNQDEKNGGEINDLVEEVQKNEEKLEDGIHLALITRRLLKTQVMENDVDDQRDNLFHTRCLVKGNVCSLIIDSGNCTNIVSDKATLILSATIQAFVEARTLESK